MKTMFIKPTTTDVGRGREPVRLRYIRGGRKGTAYELPTDGAFVTLEGEEGIFWRKRVAEKSAEKTDPPKDVDPEKLKLKLIPRSNPNEEKIAAAHKRAKEAREAQKKIAEAKKAEAKKAGASAPKPKPAPQGQED